MREEPSTSNPKGSVRRMPGDQERRARHPASILLASSLAALSALYIINPSAGVFELLPDNLPGIGNLDEAAATTLLLSMLAYLGINIRPLRAILEKLDRRRK